VITNSGVAVEIEDRLADLVRKNPGETLISFQLARVDLMLRFEPEKGRALLQDLTQASDVKLADAAKLRLLKEQMVGKPEVNRDTMAFRGGLRVLTGFCYTLFFLVSLRTHIVIHIIIRAQCGPTTHFS